MADSRSWLHQKLLATPALVALMGDGAASVLQHKSFFTAPQKRPFVVVRSSIANPALRDGGVSVAVASHHHVWVHDDPGSYLAIDSAIAAMRAALEAAPSDAQLIKAEWIETSEDLEDPDMGTILRWCRLRLVHLP